MHVKCDIYACRSHVNAPTGLVYRRQTDHRGGVALVDLALRITLAVTIHAMHDLEADSGRITVLSDIGGVSSI